MSGENTKMDGKSWAILIIVIILSVILSTISSWFNMLIQAVGRQIAWLIVSIIIAVLIVTLVALLIAHPTALNEIVDMVASNAVNLSEKASSIIANTVEGVSSIGSKLLTPLLFVGGGFLLYYSLKARNEKD